MELFIKEHIAEKEKKRLFLVHGICEHSGRYNPFIEALNKADVSVISYDLRGHGLSLGKRGTINSFKTHLNDLSKIINQYFNDKVENILFGHSMGGLIGHLYLVSNPKVSRYISSGAPTDFINKVKPFKVIPFQLIGWVTLKNSFANGSLSTDKEIEDNYLSDPLVLKKYKVKLAGEMFVKGIKYLQKNFNKHQLPTLFLHGEKDQIVPCEMSVNMFNKLPNINNKLIIYGEMQHEILNEIEKEKVIKDIIGWIYE